VWGYRVNRFLKVGFVLGVLQFLVFLSGWDHLIEVGPFREHRFIELPAFYLLGRGFVTFFHDLGWNDRAALLGVLEVYLFNVLVSPQGLDSSAILAELLCLSRTFWGWHSRQRYMVETESVFDDLQPTTTQVDGWASTSID